MALAKVEASWATRYLAVIVGPLILVAAVGLARAGGTGAAALAITIVLVVQPITRMTTRVSIRIKSKSNATLIGEQFAADLRPGDWIIVTQREEVPLFRPSGTAPGDGSESTFRATLYERPL